MKKRIHWAWAFALGLASCSVLAPVSDSTRFFVLNGLTEGSTRSGDRAPLPSDTTCGLGPIKFPAYLDRNEVATRIAPTQLSYSQTDQWAEPLATNVSNVLFGNLSDLLATDRIVAYPWAAPVDYQVSITFLRFDCDSAGQCQLAASWTIFNGRDGRILLTRDTSVTRAAVGAGTAAATTALSGTLGTFSEEIASALRDAVQTKGSAGKP